VRAKADVCHEDEFGWTAAHYAPGSGPLRKALKGPSAFWATFDPDKPRGTSNARYLARRGGHSRIPLHDRRDVLRGDWSLAGIARRILDGKSKSVVLLFGAGISTNCGIPDYRSKLGLIKDEDSRRLFSPGMWEKEPSQAWRKTFELLGLREGAVRPGVVHHFARLLEVKGLLLRCYTQNVDGLERVAGVSDERMVHCHGEARRARCTACQWKASVTVDRMGDGRGADIPPCQICGASLRPDVTFFGEPMARKFEEKKVADFKQCDLLIVAGTTLMVYPVAGLVKQVDALCPRLLINDVRVGLWAESSPSETSASYRDVCYEGDVDRGFNDLANDLGWEAELAQLRKSMA